MDFFKDVSKKISEAGKVVGDKSKQITESANLSYKISTAEREMEELYAVLGKLVYEEEKGKADSAYFSKCEEISAKQDEITDLKSKKNALSGVVICQNCGAEVSKDNEFCGKCGARIIKPVSEPVSTEETASESPEETEAKEEKTEE